MKILLIEEDSEMAAYLNQGLSEAGFCVDLRRDGNQGLHSALTEAYDSIVLDIVLPDPDGWHVLQAIRRAGRDVPIMLIDSEDRVDNRVKGLELGADDCLVKPFVFSEFLVRMRTLMRHRLPSEATRMRVADLELDLLRRRVTRAGTRIDLTAREFSLLELLLRRQGEVLPRSLIASQVWDMNFDSDTNVIDVAVCRLRSKIDDPFDIKFIRTVRGMGYVLEGPDCN
ncbi:heavy metal response regulator transcription factor [Sulfuritalea sp.]|uniref:heavy metal response regulator transcription factor n=1 Tax=Sulfuritalea sp. TaxID=2480090 RepID=UPI001AC0DCDE|nr:heavy metal response regulator transcription factor [Sulfuritalea sp.]MBN8475743.1 heavy metal response regulator transcription factor [Sulfuritalea sp.]